MRRLLPYLLAFALGLGAAVVTACGEKTNPAMIPAENAEALKADLDAVLEAIGDDDCDAAEEAIAQVETDLLELPPGTSRRLQDRLTDGLARLREQSAKECRPRTATTTTETQPTVTTTTVPTTTTTTAPPPTTPPTTTTAPPTTPTEPTDTTGGLEPAPSDDTGGAPTP